MTENDIIKIVQDLIDTPEHCETRWSVEKKGLDLIDKIETEQLNIEIVSKSFKCCKESDKCSVQCDDCNMVYNY